MPATFILSWDCEGKWGVADNITPFVKAHYINEKLNPVYDRILALLERYSIPATFAFVGAHTFSPDEYKKRRDLFPMQDPWFRFFHEDARHERFDGWLNPLAFEKVLKHPQHEIASHGFSHRPLCESLATKEQAAFEFASIRKLSAFRDALTFIYPRNLVGHVNELSQHGFVGYRAGTQKVRSPWQRMAALVEEWLPWRAAEAPSFSSAPTEIPSGHIINWRFGLRASVPEKLTVYKVQSALNDAEKRDGVVHLWSHPHNFVTGKDMFSLFERILEAVSESRKRHGLQLMTQLSYVRSQAPSSPVAAEGTH